MNSKLEIGKILVFCFFIRAFHGIYVLYNLYCVSLWLFQRFYQLFNRFLFSIFSLHLIHDISRKEESSDIIFAVRVLWIELAIWMFHIIHWLFYFSFNVFFNVSVCFQYALKLNLIIHSWHESSCYSLNHFLFYQKFSRLNFLILYKKYLNFIIQAKNYKFFYYFFYFNQKSLILSIWDKEN